MADKKYTSRIRRVAARPRAERLRKLGTATASASASIVSAEGGSVRSVPSSSTSHTHANKSDLDRLSISTDDYLLIQGTEDKAKAKSGYSDESAHSVASDKAALAGNSTQWEGHDFGDYVDQPVRKGDDVSFSSVKFGVSAGSADFSTGIVGGKGWQAWLDAMGKSHLEIDNLMVRAKALFAELEVHEMTFVGGTVVMSTCGNRMAIVEAIDGSGNVIATANSDSPTITIPIGKVADKFRCYFLASDGDRQIKNEWTVGQLARCKTNNIAKPGDYTDYENRDYWRLVVAVSEVPVTIEGKDYHYIDLSNSTSNDINLTDKAGTTRHVTLGGVCTTMTSLPYAGDNVIGLGHCWDTDRQNAAILSVLSLGWTLYKGIDHYDLPEENIVNKFGIDKTIVTTDHYILRPYAAPKESQTVAVVRGAYDDKGYYGHNDLVTYNGQLWIASGVKIGETITGQKPADDSPYWILAAAKGIQGEKGDNYTIAFLLNDVPIDSLNFDDVKNSGSATLEADFYNKGVSANIPKASITCYDGSGSVLGSPIEASNSDNVVVDAGNLYLSKGCKNITVVCKDESGNLLVSKSIGVVRNGKDATELVSLVLYLTSGALTWRSGQGKIATLAAAVTKGNYDITDAQDASQFVWTRESSDSQGDKDWNSQHKFGSKTLEVSEGDMCGNITSFVCTLHKSTGEVYTMAKQDFTI